MSASKCAVDLEAQFLLRAAGRKDLENPGLLSQCFNSASPGIGRDLEITALRSLLAAGNLTPRIELFAEGADGSVACLIAEDKPWDSAMLSVAARNLTVLVSPPKGRARYRIISRLLELWIDAHPAASEGLTTARISADDTAALQALEDHEFHVLVPMVTLGRTIEETEVALPPEICISGVESRDIDPIASIAATAFLWGRFAADPLVPQEAAEKVHRTWARNCCLGTHAKHVLVARRGKDVLGFVALKFQMAGEVKTGSIELVAASEASRGAGIGRALVQAGCNWLSTTANYVVVRTELPNIPAVRMYEAQGFRVLSSSIYLSRWNDSAASM